MAIRVPPGGSSLGSFLSTTSALALGGPRSQIVNGWAPDVALDIDFTTGTLDSRITFARASTATYYNSSGLVASAASDAPRFDYDPVTRAPRGLLLEEQRTNQLTYSNDFSNAAWVKGSGSSVTAQDATGPDGVANSAWSVVIGNGGPGIYQVHTWLSTPMTGSIWLRAKSGTPQVYIEFGSGAGSTLFTLSTTWQRYMLSHATGNQFFEIRTDYPASLPSATIEIYGAQVEAPAAATVTSYILTAGASVTRAADTASMTGTNFSSWFNNIEGTFVVSLDFPALTPGYHFLNAFRASNATANRVVLYGDSGVFYDYIVDDIVGNTKASSIIVAVTGPSKLALAFKANDAASAANGTAGATDTSVTIPTVDSLNLGRSEVGGSLAPGWYKRLTFYNTRKSNSELAALTAPDPTGTGTLTAQAGVVASTTGFSRSIAPSVALVAQAATAASTTGVSGSLITDTTINAGSAVVASATGVSGSLITDTTITASSAVVASTTGVSRSIAPSVALAAQAAAAASTTGLSRSIATPVALAAQQSVISGLGGAGTTLVGTGVVTTRPALVAGAGLTASAGVGALQVSVATIDAHGVSAWIATAANLNVDLADIDGLGEIPYNTVVSGPYAQVGDLWEGAAVWGKIAGKWRRLRLWTKAADAWGIAAWDQATQEVDVWSLPAYGELDARGAHIAGSGFIRDQIWGAGDLRAGPALVTDSSSLSGLSVITNAAWEATPAWVKVNGKWRRATMWTNVSAEWKRVA